MKVSRKLPAVIAGLALLCSAGVGTASYISGAGIVRSQAAERLMAVAESRKDMLVDTLGGLQSTVLANAGGKTMGAALTDFEKGWKKYGEEAEARLLKTYVTDNPHPEDQRGELVKAGRKPYDRSHSKFHPVLRQHALENGFKDLLLVNSSGRVVYSVNKTSDFAADLRADAWKETAAAAVFERAMEGGAGTAAMLDLQPYEANGNRPTSFIAAPIALGKKKIGALIYHVPTERISGLLGKYAGLGETGNVFYVNQDGLIQNDSFRTETESEILKADLNRSEVTSVLGGEPAFTKIDDFQGVKVEAAIVPFSFMDRSYAVVVAQSMDEVHAPLVSLRNLILAIAFASALFAGAVGIFFARGLSGRIRRLSEVMMLLAGGNTDAQVPEKSKNADEIDDMTETVDVFRKNAIKRTQLEQEQLQARQMSEEQGSRLRTKIEGFREEISGMLNTVAEDSEEMRQVAEDLNGIADATSHEATVASAASEQASGNVQTVASASEELSASIQEIARQVSSTTDIVHQAVDTAAQTNTKIEGLAESAQRIGDVVRLISEIAEQTNLLALNATIEAARAGEAGKGFAVVAAEVKELSTQTAKATEDIGSQVTEVQNATKEAVVAIQGISATMNEVNSYTASIATAVEEQGAATREISVSVQEAAHGTQNVAQTMVTISDKVNDTNQSATRVLTSTSSVSERTGQLQSTVDRFLSEVLVA